MKKLLTFAVALFIFLFTSCSEDIGDCLSETEQACDFTTGKIYTGSGKIYMVSSEEAMLEVGTMSNGKVTLALPENVDSRFLRELYQTILGGPMFFLGMYPDSSDAKVWTDMEPLRLADNSGKHIGNLEHLGLLGEEEDIYSKIYYWYFSKDTKINYPNDLECVFHIDAKKGWNKIYFSTNFADKTCYTTDLSKAQNGFMWVVSPPNR
ncbi:MAG: hypothetical protein LBU89_03170 [Fibromonadaceae bacterium]|jgi:hypothetical protein|nr:hypothetical protein [Fibromonadaceae bacterium]